MSSKSQKLRQSSATPVPQISSSLRSSTPAVQAQQQQASQQQQQQKQAFQDGSSSPVSPTRYSRLLEKTELQNLNDRLACYIDRVRNLETENSRLLVEIRSTKENIHRETSSIKQMYEKEVNDARKLLDETASERAKLEIDTKRLWEENADLLGKVEKLKKDFINADNSKRLNETRLNDLQGRYNQAANDRKKAEDECKDLNIENERFRKQLEEIRKHLEDETLARVELENAIQSLREELSFKDSIHKQELLEVNSHRQVEISEIDGRLAEQYEAKLQQSLQELRDQYEDQLAGNRDDIQKLYEDKIMNLQQTLDRNSIQAGNAIDELRITRSKIDSLNSKIIELEHANGTLNSRIRSLEKIIDDERARHGDEIQLLEAELNRLREEMSAQLKEYQDLMDIKVSLDLEIAAYDALLKGEESRLNITPNSKAQLSQSIRSTRRTTASRTPALTKSALGVKRKRTFEDEEHTESEFFFTTTSKGDISVSEVDPEGKFIKVHNKSDKEISIGGWQLVRKAGPNETHHKFHRSVKIDGNGTITIWSSDAGVQHEPPLNIVMKQQRWFVSDNMWTLIYNADGEEIAVAERIKKLITTRVSRHRSTGVEDLYHQEGDPASRNSENCFIM